MFATLLSVAAALLAGFMLASAFLPLKVGWNRQTCFLTFLGLGFGLGLTSVIWFVSWWLFGPSLTPAITFEGVALVAIAWKFKRRTSDCLEFAAGGRSSSLVAFVILIATGVAVSTAILFSVRLFRIIPHGEWDAWSVWNLHARFLFLGGVRTWNVMSAPELNYSNADYPLMLPMSIFRVWCFQGTDSVLGPQVIGFVFLFGTAGLLASAITLIRDPLQGCLALVALLGVEPYVHTGSAEYADIPLSYFVLCAVVLLTFYEESEARFPGFIALAGLSAGFAAWTKNEGQLFLITILLSQLLKVLWRRDGRVIGTGVAWFVAGAAGPVAMTLAYKMALAPRSDVMTWTNGADLFQRLFDLHRLGVILRTLALEVWSFGGWVPEIVVLGIVYFVCFGIVTNLKQGRAALENVTILVLMLTGEIFVYLVGRYDIAWWLSTSATRLLEQLWPAALFVFFTALRGPGALQSSEGTESPRSAPSPFTVS
jgi:hypothetical protein